MAVQFIFQEVAPLKALQKNKVKSLIRQILTDFSFLPGDINYVFTTDEFLLGINQQYLKHDDYTDIITFPNYEGNKVHGDVLISLERIKENAVEFKTGLLPELLRVIIHGTLHLCDMTDKTPAQRKAMTEKEDFYLGVLNSMV
ncbi:MAG: rRNA maturation RNase YbeY [Bacteroidetes bacterium HGW-Bacteroidetes-21]|jgi:rRNA maturation RNase YbeY|nr:MAG: rRNA maturation RNase YbeY [Bacteroidetes bacterium HGW-Bacteroidetes-21]